MRRASRTHCWRRGMTLIGVTSALMVLAVAGTIAAHLLARSGRMQSAMQMSHNARSQYDHSLRQLRTDIWGAIEINLRSEGTLEILHSGGADIVWQFNSEERRLERHTASASTLWQENQGTVSFRPITAGVQLTWSDPAGKPATSVTLPSQYLLAREAR